MSGEQKEILIADDDLHTRELLEVALTDEGYKVISVHDGNALVEKAKQGERPDLIITDIKMPPLGGIEALRQIRAWEEEEKKPMVQAIVTTALSELSIEPMREDIEKLAQGFIPKPYNLHELIEQIKNTFLA